MKNIRTDTEQNKSKIARLSAT